MGLTCNSCNKEFKDDAEQKLHYKSDWHRYNLKRKLLGGWGSRCHGRNLGFFFCSLAAGHVDIITCLEMEVEVEKQVA
ncbi:unnamed protein product [Linum trigynum]|uniref:C2H2-type domain-containing protein n=1 Tax=Linum trigynum TaxID=586398 RepID=A0AAV2E7H9_9ROSI